jgi:hypothetical protein
MQKDLEVYIGETKRKGAAILNFGTTKSVKSTFIKAIVDAGINPDELSRRVDLVGLTQKSLSSDLKFRKTNVSEKYKLHYGLKSEVCNACRHWSGICHLSVRDDYVFPDTIFHCEEAKDFSELYKLCLDKELCHILENLSKLCKCK